MCTSTITELKLYYAILWNNIPRSDDRWQCQLTHGACAYYMALFDHIAQASKLLSHRQTDTQYVCVCNIKGYVRYIRRIYMLINMCVCVHLWKRSRRAGREVLIMHNLTCAITLTVRVLIQWRCTACCTYEITSPYSYYAFLLGRTAKIYVTDNE